MKHLPLIVVCLLIGWNAHHAYGRNQRPREAEPARPIPPEPDPWYVERVVRDMAYRSRWDC